MYRKEEATPTRLKIEPARGARLYRLGMLVLIAAAHWAGFCAEQRFVSTEVKNERWLEKFEHLRRLDRKLRDAFPEVFSDDPVAYSRPPISAPTQVGLYESMLGRELAALSATVNRLVASRRKRPAATVRSYLHTVRRTSETYTIDLPATARVENVWLRISNVGLAADVVNPRLVLNGKRDWFDVESIKREALAGAQTDRDKAIALWRFLAENRYHFKPAHASFELHDPVRFLNIYGYGFCDDSAANFAALARSAGLGGRVWGLSGHVVPEAFYDGAWHLFDPDGKVYYLEDDGKTVASVEEVARDPHLLENAVAVGRPLYSADRVREIYTTTENNRVSDWYRRTSSTSHRMAFTLRPGETICRYWQGDGRFFTSRYFEEPPTYGRGEWIYQPPLDPGVFRAGTSDAAGLRIGQFRGSPAILATTTTACFSHEFRLPYPILNGWIEIACSSDDERNKIAVEIAVGQAEAGENAWTGGGKGDLRVVIPLGCYFPNGYGAPAYRCKVWLRFTKRGRLLAITRVRYHFDFQVAPASLPALEPARNRARYWQENEEPPQVEIEHSYVLTGGDSN